MSKSRYWAKTGQGQLREDGRPLYHPVLCHLADTAAVAMEIVQTYLSPLARQQLSVGLGLEGDPLARFCGFMAGCHDLGKVSPAFQFQVSEVGKALVGSRLYDLWRSYPNTGQAAPHGTVTAATLPGFLEELGLPKKLAQKLSAIVGGHHGFFPGLQDIQSLSPDDVGRGEWIPFRREIFQQLQDFVGLKREGIPARCSNSAAMILAGLATVADWIASNTESFPYANDEPFETYAQGIAEKAQQALKAQGWIAPPTDSPLTFQALFDFISEPRPLQLAAINLKDRLAPPCLVIVEAAMGEGKTEAALYLADHLQHQAGAGGFYIGLPTQATSNAMFERVKSFLQKRYPDAIVNLTLSHGAAALKEDYLDTVCRLDQVYDQEGKGVFASEWHTARKRTLLSPYGVGTLDQALMGAVRARHQFVRLFGLAGRIIILDEIHAYDLYTSTLLERFLEWAAVLGSPVIALSATLPAGTRQRLLAAYARGCGQPPPDSPNAPYPRITALASGAALAQSFAPSEHVRRQLGIRWVRDDQWPAELSQVLSKGGGCVAVICSTVDRAQWVFQHLQKYFPPEELGLFHGRFLFKDREQIEKQCLERFGKNGHLRPSRFVLVATQVIEQSLDVDFDLMISDPAPIDLLLQRSGRLHRHPRDKRPPELSAPYLWIVEPELAEEGKANFRESSSIYDRHILLRSWLALRERCNVQLPEEIDDLIESVYDLEMPIPEALETVHAQDWRESLEKYKVEEEDAKRSRANEVKIPPPNADVRPEQFTYLKKEDDESTIAAVTRLGQPSVATIFLQQGKTGLVFPGSHDPVDLETEPSLPMIRRLLAHSVRIASRQELVKELLRRENPKTWTSALLRNCRYVVLNAEGWAQVGKWRLRLDPNLGITIEKMNS